MTSSYDVYNGQINRIISASGNDDNQYQAMLTSSSDTKFDGTQYCYPEIIRSGSSWLTVTSSRYCEAVTPYISSSRVSEIYQLLYSETPATSTSTSSFKEFPGTGDTRENPHDTGTENDWINPDNITSGGDTFSEVPTTQYSDVLHASSWSWSSLLSINDADNLLGLEVDVKAELDQIGHKKESYNDIIKRILLKYKEVMQLA